MSVVHITSSGRTISSSTKKCQCWTLEPNLQQQISPSVHTKQLWHFALPWNWCFERRQVTVSAPEDKDYHTNNLNPTTPAFGTAALKHWTCLTPALGQWLHSKTLKLPYFCMRSVTAFFHVAICRARSASARHNCVKETYSIRPGTHKPLQVFDQTNYIFPKIAVSTGGLSSHIFSPFNQNELNLQHMSSFR